MSKTKLKRYISQKFHYEKMWFSMADDGVINLDISDRSQIGQEIQSHNEKNKSAIKRF